MIRFLLRKGAAVALVGLLVPTLVCAQASKRIDVLVIRDGEARWVRVPSESPTDQMGRIAFVLIGGQRVQVEATRHSEAGKRVTVERLAAGDDIGPGQGTVVEAEEVAP